MNRCLLMMGGVGSRFGADCPKQYVEVDGRPIFIYILKRLVQLQFLDSIVVVSNKEWIDFTWEAIYRFVGDDSRISVVPGGETRSASVKNGLIELKRKEAVDGDVVLIHDATHPYVDEEGMRKIIKAVKEFGGATLGACQYDTCYRMNGENEIEDVVPRQYIVSGASPEAFRFQDIYEIYMNSTEEELVLMTSAGAIALAHHIRMLVIPSSVLNLKITYSDDMKLFKKLVHNYFF